jgi:glycerol uptake facilitator-like aquaporin
LLSATADAAMPAATAPASDPTAQSAEPHPAPGATPPPSPLAARAAAELVGTAALVAVVVGSGIQATELTHDVALQLLANSTATVFGLGILIALFGPVSGAHFNPVVTLAEWWTARRGGPGVTLRDAAAYIPAQTAGAILGAVLADAMFAKALVKFSSHDRSAGHLLLGEVVATAGLILLVFGLARTDRLRFAPVAVASYIGAAYWFTSSTSFANPAVTIGRTFTDTFAGIAPASVAPFLAAQLAGGGLGLVLVAVAIGRPVPATGDGVVVTHGERRPTSPARPTEESAVSS